MAKKKSPEIQERNDHIYKLWKHGVMNYSEIGRLYGISHTQVIRIIDEKKGLASV